MVTGRELADDLLIGPRQFRPEWTVAPLARFEPLRPRIAAAAMQRSVNHVLVGTFDDEHVAAPLDEVGWRTTDVLWCLPDRSGALFTTNAGYALLAGQDDFMSAAAPEGVDAVRARFARVAGKLMGQWPELAEVAEEFGPSMKAWKSPAEVDPGTGVAAQIDLTRSLARGEITASLFASGWLAARRWALNEGERTREPFDRILNEVFYALEDYSIDPELRAPEDLTDDQLADRVRGALGKLDDLDKAR